MAWVAWPKCVSGLDGDNSAMAQDEITRNQAPAPKGSRSARRKQGSGYHKILIALDFSRASRLALEEGVELARLHGASLLLCTALTGPNLIHLDRRQGDTSPVNEDELDRAEARLHAQAKAVGLGPGEYEVKVLSKDPGNEIPKLAEALGCDLIIVANRGHSPKRRFFLGSVAESILRNSRTTVLVSKGR